MIVAGIGCRRGTSSQEIQDAIAAATADVGLPFTCVGAIATGPGKAGEAGITDAATRLGLPLLIVDQPALEAASIRGLSRSAHVLAVTGVPSLAEAAALAAAGPASRLLGARMIVGPIACALATAELAV